MLRFLSKCLMEDNALLILAFTALDMSIGQTTYSPDASMFAFNTAKGVYLFDFDNETGILSNYQKIEYPTQENVAQGLAFSPNNRYIYVTTAEDIHQIDVELLDVPYHVAQHTSVDTTGWPVGVGMISSGPDCRLYVSPGSSTFYLHVIHHPDEKGADCAFQPRAIKLPVRLGHHLPNLPNYRYLTGCDPDIAFGFPTGTDDVYEVPPDLLIYPNPTSQEINIQLEQRPIAPITISIYNALGSKMKQHILNDQQTTIDIQSYPAGVHLIEDNESNITTKFIKID